MRKWERKWESERAIEESKGEGDTERMWQSDKMRKQKSKKGEKVRK